MNRLWENHEIGDQHNNHNVTSIYRRIQVVVRLTQESGWPVAQVAREIEFSDNALYRWLSEQQQGESQGRMHQAVRAEQDELTRLKRENEILRKERDFLTRAAACFARASQ